MNCAFPIITTRRSAIHDLLYRLRRAFDVGIYNLNYDIGVLSACPGAYTGFDDNAALDANDVHARLEGILQWLDGQPDDALALSS